MSANRLFLEVASAATYREVTGDLDSGSRYNKKKKKKDGSIHVMGRAVRSRNQPWWAVSGSLAASRDGGLVAEYWEALISMRLTNVEFLYRTFYWKSDYSDADGRWKSVTGEVITRRVDDVWYFGWTTKYEDIHVDWGIIMIVNQQNTREYPINVV